MEKKTETCSTCRKYRTVRCEERKQSGHDPQPEDWCNGFKKGGQKIERIDDGFGCTWSKTCPNCGGKSMEVVRPGKAQCSICG